MKLRRICYGDLPRVVRDGTERVVKARSQFAFVSDMQRAGWVTGWYAQNGEISVMVLPTTDYSPRPYHTLDHHVDMGVWALYEVLE